MGVQLGQPPTPLPNTWGFGMDLCRTYIFYLLISRCKHQSLRQPPRIMPSNSETIQFFHYISSRAHPVHGVTASGIIAVVHSMGKLKQAVTALKRKASSVASKVKRKKRKGGDAESAISVDSSSSGYRSPTVEDADDEDDQPRGSTAVPEEDAAGGVDMQHLEADLSE